MGRKQVLIRNFLLRQRMSVALAFFSATIKVKGVSSSGSEETCQGKFLVKNLLKTSVFVGLLLIFIAASYGQPYAEASVILCEFSKSDVKYYVELTDFAIYGPEETLEVGDTVVVFLL